VSSTKEPSIVPFELPHRDPCPFCEIIAGKLKQGIVEESDLTVTFVNMRQFEVGQILVVPRRHAPTVLDLTLEEGAAIMKAAQRVASAMIAAFSPDGITIYQNNGLVSLQEIPHYHMHVVPRRKSSPWGYGPPHIAALEKPSKEELSRVVVSAERSQEIAEQLRLCMKR
jgi:histidine triad (HIT) family protein